MNLDRFCILFCFLLLSIFWFPLDYFYWAIWGSSLGAIIVFSIRKRMWGAFFIILSVSFYQVQQIAKNTQNVTAYQTTENIKIIQILHQIGYQTAIAQLENSIKLYLKWQTDTPLELERNYQASLKIRPISSRLNTGNFNRQQWYFANNINAIATVKKANLIQKSRDHLSTRTRWLERVKQQTEKFATQGLMLALSFGERAWLNNQTWQPFKQTATAHLIAISGLHIGLVMWLGFGLAKLGQYVILLILNKTSGHIFIKFCKKLALSYRLPFLLGLCCALGYAFLANFSTPTLRALLAISFVLCFQFARRHYTPMQFWWRIVVVLLICNPIALLSSSFWLSILAVLCLIIWYRYFPLKKILEVLPFNDKWLKAKSVRFILKLLHLQIGILLLFAPVQFYFFEGLSPFGFIANLIIVPFYSLIIVPFILFSLVTDNLFDTWQIVDDLLQMSLDLLTPLSHSWFFLSQYQQWQYLTVNLFILLILYTWLNYKFRQYWKQIIIATVIFNSLFYAYYFTKPRTQWITFDVGQGLANALVYQHGLQTKAVLYDTGVSWGKGKAQNSMAKLEILPYLKRNGIKVDAIFLSHDDKDHSGGIVDILKAYPKARLISSSNRKYANRQTEPCIQGKQWQFGKFHLQVYYPKAVTFKAKNANSCVILVKIQNFKILLTGDITQNEEPYFSQKIGRVDFLQVPHHGSKTSTSYTLLNYTKPKFAMVSTGRWNIWHLPNKNIIKRLEKRNIKVLDTAKVGMITVNFYDQKYKVKVARGENSSWYNDFFR
ncbi:DNA internalization-related competence protein ComEC/Rec2 [Pasteurella atlantica]|uniref:DNA internalization-related competence protein ComEC/Rec2 n=2 Tax=Pasteurellaceae TaxID=712 RepID=UPI002744A38F|nr:DNA internalization-related competence protein ComEC/Rec2 [Pasteurella atlantica]MDP8036267.1 DNA internalization-related competence protein ComEC/Rec2 [Pasteurella atlantica]MDP8038230.1 DNA internalization-related competence protein ComEC/Rec2 [Pasteurella atlantica]MDP8048572.1 DNA internalization-related competence protein ComEC/Rec2 [Pasteurella atlantica]MDP8053951.1 DNA internalization-related competence protein ComEC/Rec2 [Pasteurella atlantica]MDP8060380.1 DNA internalization-relat